MEETLFYIKDTYGTYYTINASNRLVPTNDKNQASKFTQGKANSVIQTMIKQMQRYQYIIREAESKREDKLKTCLNQMKGLENRKYTPRILDELFEEAS